MNTVALCDFDMRRLRTTLTYYLLTLRIVYRVSVKNKVTTIMLLFEHYVIAAQRRPTLFWCTPILCKPVDVNKKVLFARVQTAAPVYTYCR